MEDKTEAIKRKIQNLLEKTTQNGASEAEAISALKKAQQLMFQYYITEKDINSTTEAPKCTFLHIPKTKSAYNMEGFVIPLTELFDCKAFTTKDDIVFFGHEEDTRLCSYFHDFITQTCLAEKENYKKSAQYNTLKSTYSPKTLIVSFIHGFLDGISTKIQEIYQERKTTLTDQQALILYDKNKIVERQFQETGIKLRPRNTKHKITDDSYQTGQTKGYQTNIRQGITTNDQQKTKQQIS